MTKPIPLGSRVILLGLYEHSAFANIAKEMCDQLARNIPKAVNTTPHLWEFGALQNPAIQELARAYAVGAGIVFLVTDGSEPPPPVRRLIEYVLNAQSVRGIAALVRVSDRSGRLDGMPVLRYLASVTENARVPLFFGGEGVPSAPEDERFELWIQRVFGTTTHSADTR